MGQSGFLDIIFFTLRFSLPYLSRLRRLKPPPKDIHLYKKTFHSSLSTFFIACESVQKQCNASTPRRSRKRWGH